MLVRPARPSSTSRTEAGAFLRYAPKARARLASICRSTFALASRGWLHCYCCFINLDSAMSFCT